MLFGTTATGNDPALGLLQDLGLDESARTPAMNALSAADSRYLKDLKLNISTALKAESLGARDASLLAFAVAVNEKNERLRQVFEKQALENGATEQELADIIACTGSIDIWKE